MALGAEDSQFLGHIIGNDRVRTPVSFCPRVVCSGRGNTLQDLWLCQALSQMHAMCEPVPRSPQMGNDRAPGGILRI
jgi:hypothetical protein